jgi:hypothetical protein
MSFQAATRGAGGIQPTVGSRIEAIGREAAHAADLEAGRHRASIWRPIRATDRGPLKQGGPSPGEFNQMVDEVVGCGVASWSTNRLITAAEEST